MDLGPSCPVCPFSTELGNTSIPAQMQGGGVLVLESNSSLVLSPIPQRERVESL
jgi:hypothetical protein